MLEPSKSLSRLHCPLRAGKRSLPCRIHLILARDDLRSSVQPRWREEGSRQIQMAGTRRMPRILCGIGVVRWPQSSIEPLPWFHFGQGGELGHGTPLAINKEVRDGQRPRDVEVLDHLIIGGRRFVSLKSRGLRFG